MSRRITQLDGIRALAITAVFLNHAFQARLLWMGVDLFFILSGFLITGILLNAKSRSLQHYFGHFYARRARRILPPYLLLLLVTSVLFGLAWVRSWYLYLGLMNFFSAFAIPHPPQLELLWSLAVEEQFYLFWPVAIFFLSERAVGWLAVGLMLLAPLLRWYATPLFAQHWAIYSLTPFRMDLLAAGALLALAWRHFRSTLERWGAFGLLASAAAAGALLVVSRLPGFATHDNTRKGNVSVYELSLILCTGVIVWALSGRGVWPLNLSPVRYLGKISYSVYLIHATALMVLLRYLPAPIPAAILAACVAVAYSALSWCFIEKPILHYRSVASGEIATESIG